MADLTKTVEITVTRVASAVDPYVPTVAKDAAGYVANTTREVANTAYATGTQAVETVRGAVGAAQTFASSKVNEAFEYGKVVVNGATTTITTYTPEPVMNIVNNALTGAQAVRSDPVGTVKPYVPAFVIHVGEKTYEVATGAVESAQKTAAGAIDSASKTAEATTGFIVTKVNGAVETVTSIPQVKDVIEQLNKLTGPVIEKVTGGKPAAAAEEKPVKEE
ncbi:hypothetical protein HK102_006311 [Quaeritorhiza haematococci]|nr:hypothetical protein HK102_006311 [Quaeritorhiza haematococci]